MSQTSQKKTTSKTDKLDKQTMCKSTSQPRQTTRKNESASKSPGRPTLYTIKLAQKIGDLIATNAESLRVICESTPGLPCDKTIYRWLRTDKPGFRKIYAEAREMQAYIYSDAMLEISKDASQDTFIDEKGALRTDHENIQRSKLRVDTLKWLMEKHAPKTYGVKAFAAGEDDVEKSLLRKELAELRARLDEQYQRDY